jgi:hypothetical protein
VESFAIAIAADSSTTEAQERSQSFPPATNASRSTSCCSIADAPTSAFGCADGIGLSTTLPTTLVGC